jgi:hypothetical protein
LNVPIWSLIEGPLIVAGLGLVLTAAAIALLWEYRRLFFADPKAVMSAEVLMQIVAQCGAPGYLAAFLLAGALLSFVSAAYGLISSVMSYFGA